MRFHSRFVVIDPETVLENAVLDIRGNRIAAVEHRSSQAAMPDTVILPGLVNAHTHVELSALCGRLKPTRRFDRWISRSISRTWNITDWGRSASDGLDRMARNGITSIGDICKRTFLLPRLRQDPIRKVVFAETYHPDPEQAKARSNELEKIIRTIRTSPAFALGISPHAPYTVSPDLYRHCLKIARRYHIPVASHVAETCDEIEFVKSGRGRLADLVRRTGWPLPFSRPPGLTPVQYVDSLGLLRYRSILIHGNYLTAKDIDLLSRRQTPVVFCPGSHRFFSHPSHPVRRLLRAGVPVALGTDSLASNTDLSILHEMSLVRKYYGIAPGEILRMATRNGASALFGKIKLGELRRSWLADCTILRVPRDMKKRDLGEYVCSEQPEVAATIVNGRLIYSSDRKEPRKDFFSE